MAKRPPATGVKHKSAAVLGYPNGPLNRPDLNFEKGVHFASGTVDFDTTLVCGRGWRTGTRMFQLVGKICPTLPHDGYISVHQTKRLYWEDLLRCSRGELFGPGNAQLPAPNML